MLPGILRSSKSDILRPDVAPAPGQPFVGYQPTNIKFDIADEGLRMYERLHLANTTGQRHPFGALVSPVNDSPRRCFSAVDLTDGLDGGAFSQSPLPESSFRDDSYPPK